MSEGLRVTILGAAGAMGRIVVRDLFETSDAHLVLADYHEAGARQLAGTLGAGRTTARAVDVTRPGQTAKLLEGSFAVVNCVQYQHNVAVMEAALQAGCHYLDLGGLFHVTLDQLKWHERFLELDRLALLGMGAAPGTTNLLARLAAQEMDEVHAVHLRVGGTDTGSSEGLESSYSIQTILEETARPPAVFAQGQLRFLEPMTPAEETTFPAPVGKRMPLLTIHSEVATLPSSFGLRECSFAIAFPGDLTEKLRFLKTVGINSYQPVQLEGREVVPHEVLMAVLRRNPRPAPPPPAADEYEILRALVRGSRGGREVEEVVEAHVVGIPAWGLGVDAGTGCPPSVAVQLLAKGVITARGALPPEQAVPTRPYFEELADRGTSVHRWEQ